MTVRALDEFVFNTVRHVHKNNIISNKALGIIILCAIRQKTICLYCIGKISLNIVSYGIFHRIFFTNQFPMLLVTYLNVDIGFIFLVSIRYDRC